MKRIFNAYALIIIFIAFNAKAEQMIATKSSTVGLQKTVESNFSPSKNAVSGSCTVFIEEVHVFGNGIVNYMYPHFQNVTGSSVSNYTDYTSMCIPYCNEPAIAVHASVNNDYYLAIYLDNDNNGVFETLISSQYLNSPVATIYSQQLPVIINQNAPLRIIISEEPITGPTDIPTCGEVEDYITCETCLPPLNTKCTPHNKFDYQTLSWDATQNAVSYEIQLVYNDPICCSPQQAIYLNTITTTATVVNIPSNGSCFSWNVRAVFANGDKSPSSSPECSCEILSPALPSPHEPADGDGPKSMEYTSQNEILEESLTLTIAPNPATNDYVEIMLSSNMEVTAAETEVWINNISGKLIYQSSISLNEIKKIGIAHFETGTYTVNIVSNNSILFNEKLIIQ